MDGLQEGQVQTTKATGELLAPLKGNCGTRSLWLRSTEQNQIQGGQKDTPEGPRGVCRTSQETV